MLSFRKVEDDNELFGTTNLIVTRVEIVPIMKNKLIPHCKSYQAYGHIKRYCRKLPSCVKCTGNRIRSQCNKPKKLLWRRRIKSSKKIKNKQRVNPDFPRQP